MAAESISSMLIQARAEFDELIKDIRPELHRYCTRMVGSVIDGEDVVQEALAKAYYALPTLTSTTNLRGWLFRIAHNKAIDHIRRYSQQTLEHLDENLPAAELAVTVEEQEMAATALALFLKLAPKQRSCVILKDVLGYSLAEISELLDLSIPAIKAALYRGRTRLRELSQTLEAEAPLLMDEQEQALLVRYIDGFNARDFDAVREMLADEVRVDLLVRPTEVSGYFYRYENAEDWHLGLGMIEDRAAILVFDPQSESLDPTHFILLTWQGTYVSRIRDYFYVRHVIQDAQVTIL